MIKKATNTAASDYALVVLMLVFSGNPVARYLTVAAIMAFAMLILVVMYSRIDKEFFTKFFIIAAGLLVLFILQYFTLNFVSWLGAFRYISVFLFGGLIYNLVGDRFAYRFFIVMFYVSLISLFGYVGVNLLNIHPPGLLWKPGCVSYGCYSFVEEHHYRNSGMFWEPGAFSGILTLCIALNIKSLPLLWKTHRLKLFVIILALLTTQSTTGYIVFFIIVMYFLMIFMEIAIIKVVILPTLLITVFLVYENAPFLQDKIKAQSTNSMSIVKGEFTNTRFGSLMLDMHYIKKHPLVGNGLNEVTRYADDPLLIQRVIAGDNLANANGFSNFLACLGVPFMFFYLLSCFMAVYKIDKKEGFLIIAVILLSLWGEQWLNFPIFAAMMFIKIKKVNTYG